MAEDKKQVRGQDSSKHDEISHREEKPLRPQKAPAPPPPPGSEASRHDGVASEERDAWDEREASDEGAPKT